MVRVRLFLLVHLVLPMLAGCAAPFGLGSGGEAGEPPSIPPLEARLESLEREAARIRETAAALKARDGAIEARIGRLEAALDGLAAEMAAIEKPAVPQAPAPPAAAPSLAAERFAIHLASYTRARDLRAGWEELSKALPDVLDPLTPQIAVFENEADGRRYLRLKAGPFTTRETANAACRAIVERGLYCVVMPFGGTPL